ncbi:MAG TPA: Fe-S protein assembly co-chaperone HscB [Chitinophagaceae bacterium]|nr:Fe-S protein assembly co-chaperone HscB [Chitinophagaceae bacterium]
MNYFELFDIPVQLKVDKQALYKKFIALSKQHHPDYFATQHAEEQSRALEISASLNKAWKTFQNPDETIKYVLQSKGLLQEEEKYQLPPGFLVKMMDINEQLVEARMEGDMEKITHLSSVISKLSTDIYEPVKEIVEHYQEGATSEKELLQVKDYYFKKKYLNRIHQQLTGKP